MRPFCLVGCGSEARAAARLTQFRVSGRDRGLNALSSSIPLTLSGLTVVLDQVGGQFLPIWPRRQGEPGRNVDGPWWTCLGRGRGNRQRHLHQGGVTSLSRTTSQRL